MLRPAEEPADKTIRRPEPNLCKKLGMAGNTHAEHVGSGVGTGYGKLRLISPIQFKALFKVAQTDAGTIVIDTVIFPIGGFHVKHTFNDTQGNRRRMGGVRYQRILLHILNEKNKHHRDASTARYMANHVYPDIRSEAQPDTQDVDVQVEQIQ